MRMVNRPLLIVALFVAALTMTIPLEANAQGYTIWQAPMKLKTVDPDLTILRSSPSVTAMIRSTTTGQKVVFVPLILPDDVIIKSLTICYELTSTSTYLDEVSLVEMSLPNTNSTFLFDPTNRQDIGATCYQTNVVTTPPNHSINGSVRCTFKLWFANTDDEISIKGVGVNVE